MTNARIGLLCLVLQQLVFLTSNLYGEDSDVKVVRAVENLGGKVEREKIYVDDLVYTVVTKVTLRMTNTSDGDLRQLTGLTQLRSLDICNTQVTDVGLAEIVALGNSSPLRSRTLG